MVILLMMMKWKTLRSTMVMVMMVMVIYHGVARSAASTCNDGGKLVLLDDQNCHRHYRYNCDLLLWHALVIIIHHKDHLIDCDHDLLFGAWRDLVRAAGGGVVQLVPVLVDEVDRGVLLPEDDRDDCHAGEEEEDNDDYHDAI